MDPKPVLQSPVPAPVESDVQCFLCNGSGRLSKERLLRELGLRQLADVAKMGVKETLDALNQDGLKFFKTVKEELEKTYQDRLQSERERLHRDHDAIIRQWQEAAQKAERAEAEKRQVSEELQRLRATSSKKGEQGEMEFVDFMQQYQHLRLGPKLPRNGDYLLSIQVDGPDGEVRWLDEAALIDVKKDLPITNALIEKLAKDALVRKLRAAFLVAHSPEQLRGKDPISRMRQADGVFVVTVAMPDFALYVDLLRPFIQALAARRPDEKDESWEAKCRVLVQQVELSLNEMGEILNQTRRIRDEMDGVDKIVEKVKKRLAALCAT